MSIYRSSERLYKCCRQEKRSIVLLGVATIIFLMFSARQQKPLTSDVSISERTPTIPHLPLAVEVTMVANIFNSTSLLRKIIKDLETDGWIAPVGSYGILQRLRKMSAGLFRNTTASFVNTKPTGHVLLEADRWKVNYIGCFYGNLKSRPLTPIRSPVHTESVTACVRKCNKEGQAYAAMSGGASCSCGRSIAKSSVLSFTQPDNLCNMKCKYGGDNRSCGGLEYASVYKITMHKQENLTLSDVHQLSTGCFIKPHDFERVFTKKVIIVNGSAAHCLIHCEQTFEAVAVWDPQLEECMCGKYDTRLPIERLQKSPVSRLCDKRYCTKMEYCKVRYMRSMRTYAHDRRCETKNFLSGRTGTLTALASFPGSGNTWVRHLIECAGGIYSGSVYEDEGLHEQGFIGELLPWNSRRTSVIKTHEFTAKGANLFEAAVVLIRNPYDALMAEYNRLAGGHVGYAEPEYFRIKEWDYFVIYKLIRWLDVIKHFSALNKVHVTFFEDIVMNPIGEVKAIIRFLGIHIANVDERMQCLVSNTGGDFKRPTRKLGFDPFTNSMKESVNIFVKKGREILEKKGLPRLPYYERA